MNKQIGALTSLRGIAALIIVIHHFSYYALPQLGVLLSSYTYFFANGYLSVDLFFILSGFVMTHVYLDRFDSGVSKSSYWQYLRARFARIYPLHLFTLLVLVALQSIELILLSNPAAFTGKFNLTALFANVFLLQAFALNCPPLFWCDTFWNEPAWSISVEFVIYCIFPFILLKISSTNLKTNGRIYLLALIADLILIGFTHNNLDNIIGIPSIARCGLECILGIITYKFYQKYQDRQSPNLDLVAIVAIGLIMHTNWGDKLRGVHDWAILPAFSLLILSISNPTTRWRARLINSPFLLYLGTISYSIYMVHWCLAIILKSVWLHKFNLVFGSNLTGLESVFVLGLFIPIVLLSGSLTYRFIELPMRDLLKPKVPILS